MKLLHMLIQYAEVLKRRDVCGCWLWKTKTKKHWSPRLAAVFFYHWGIEVRSWQCSLLGKNGSGRLFLHLCLQAHNLNNQDFRDLLEHV